MHSNSVKKIDKKIHKLNKKRHLVLCDSVKILILVLVCVGTSDKITVECASEKR